MLISAILLTKNFYYFRKIQTKEYFEKGEKSNYLKYISIYWIVIVFFIGIYARPLTGIAVPDNYFKINIEKIIPSNDDEVIVLLKDIDPTQYLHKISSKTDKNADYDVIIYNFPATTLEELNKVYVESEHFPELYNSLNYSYIKVVEAQKINLLKFEYEMLHEDNQAAISTLKKYS